MKPTLLTLFALVFGYSAAILFLTGCGPSADQIREQQRQERIAKNKPYWDDVERREDEIKQINRFQLLSARVSNDGQAEPCLFRIDTATGKTWRYLRRPAAMRIGTNVFQKAIDLEGWCPVLEDYFTESERIWTNSDRTSSESSANEPLDLQPVTNTPDFDTPKPVTNSPSATP